MGKGNSDKKSAGGRTLFVAMAVVVTLVTATGFVWLGGNDLAASAVPGAGLRVDVGQAYGSGYYVAVPVTVENYGTEPAPGGMVEVCTGSDTCKQLYFSEVPAGGSRLIEANFPTLAGDIQATLAAE